MPFAVRARSDWQLRSSRLPLGQRTLLMGILNVTPNSFSDGNTYFSVDGAPGRAVDRALAMLDEGADLIDIGGESTRPGAGAVAAAEEQARVLPVIDALLQIRPAAILSVDTYHAETARRAVEAGVEIVNDVSGLTWDRAMAAVVAELQVGVVLMHARGKPGEWRTLPALAADEILPTVRTGLGESLRLARSAGVEPSRIVLDPGFGFGKRGAENLVLHAGLEQLQELSYPLLVGTSRKSFLAPREAAAEDRLAASLASDVAAVLAGTHLIRTHDVRAARAACDVADAILNACGAAEAVPV